MILDTGYDDMNHRYLPINGYLASTVSCWGPPRTYETKPAPCDWILTFKYLQVHLCSRRHWSTLSRNLKRATKNSAPWENVHLIRSTEFRFSIFYWVLVCLDGWLICLCAKVNEQTNLWPTSTWILREIFEKSWNVGQTESALPE